MKNKGFSLLELLVVISIIGMLATIAIPSYLKFKAKARFGEAHAYVATIKSGQTAFFTEYNGYHSSLRVIGFSPMGKVRFNIGFGFPGNVPPNGPPTDVTYMNTLSMCGGPFGSNPANTTCVFELPAPQIGNIASTVSASNYLLTVLFLEEALVASNSNERSLWENLIFGSTAYAFNQIPTPILPGGYPGQELTEVTWLFNAQGLISKSVRTVMSGGF